jgi:ribokinase
VDTTGAGDTYLGYFASNLDQKKSVNDSMEIASFAAALQVTRYGTSEAIPRLSEVKMFWRKSGIQTLALH